MTSGGTLERRLGVADAVVIGAGSMIGAGVFAAWSPAADAAEVRNPAITIPRAIPRALAAVLAVYLVVGVTALATVPASVLAGTAAPLHLVVEAGRLDALAPLVDIGAGIAALGVLLNLIPGVSRTSLAMARERELPHWFAHIDPARSLPLRAELTVAAIVIALIVVLDLRSAIGISGVAVLTYYAITNASALTLHREQRRWPPAIAVVGLIGCATLVATLPPTAVLTGLGTLLVGVAVRSVTRPRTR